MSCRARSPKLYKDPESKPRRKVVPVEAGFSVPISELMSGEIHRMENRLSHASIPFNVKVPTGALV